MNVTDTCRYDQNIGACCSPIIPRFDTQRVFHFPAAFKAIEVVNGTFHIDACFSMCPVCEMSLGQKAVYANRNISGSAIEKRSAIFARMCR